MDRWSVFGRVSSLPKARDTVEKRCYHKSKDRYGQNYQEVEGIINDPSLIGGGQG